MQITKNTINNLNTVILTVSINKEDYKEKLEELIIKKKKNLQINGFRKGQVPINIIKNKYENSLKSKCIEELLQKHVYAYIHKEKIEIIGDILLIKQENNDLYEKNISFQFEIGIVPEFKLECDQLDLYHYNIILSDEEIDKYIEKLKNYFNKIESDKILNENDIIVIEFEIILKNKKIINKDFYFIFNKLPNSIRSLLTNNKIGTFLYINSKDFFIELKHFNNVMNYKFKEHVPIRFFIKKIYHTDKTIINNHLFDKIYGKNVIKSEKDFKSKIKLEFDKIFFIKSNELLFNSLISILLKSTIINLPKNFLQRWIQNKYSMTIEETKKEYKNIEKQICQELIKNKLYKLYDIEKNKIQNNHELNAKNINLETLVKEIIKNYDNINIISNKYFAEKISILKKKLNIKNKYCSLNEFKEIFFKK